VVQVDCNKLNWFFCTYVIGLDFFWITTGFGSWKNLSLPGVFNGPKTWTKPPPGVENCNDGLLARPNCAGVTFCNASPFITLATESLYATLLYCVGVANGAGFCASLSISWRWTDG